MPQNLAHRPDASNPYPYSAPLRTKADELCELAMAINSFAPGALVPLSGDPRKPKKPLVEGWRSPDGVPLSKVCGQIRTYSERTPETHPMLGLVTGKLSGLTVVDVDLKERASHLHDQIRERVEKLFGPSPFVAITPSGGEHWFYKWNGEGNADLRQSHQLPVDIRGEGGQVAIAPSWRHDGQAYRWRDYGDATNGWFQLCQSLGKLPVANSHVSARSDEERNLARSAKVQAFADSEPASRNNLLFDQLLKLATQGHDEDALTRSGLDIAADLSKRFPKDHPVSEDEVRRSVASIMKMRRENRLFATGQTARAIVSKEAITSNLSDAGLRLQQFLECAHLANGNPFPIASEAMAQNDVIPGWSRQRYDKSRRELVERGYLDLLKQGGKKGKGDASLYRLNRRLGDSQNFSEMVKPLPERGPMAI